MRNLQPEHPHDAGIAEAVPDQSHIEGAELLSNESRQVLRSKGFTDREIEEWSWSYIAERGSGDVESFLSWMEDKERSR